MYKAYDVIFENKCEENEFDNFFCKICKFPLASYSDFLYNKESNCCNECYLTFAESRKQLWKEGWRPDKTVVEAYIYKRRQSVLGVKDEL